MPQSAKPMTWKCNSVVDIEQLSALQWANSLGPCWLHVAIQSASLVSSTCKLHSAQHSLILKPVQSCDPCSLLSRLQITVASRIAAFAEHYQSIQYTRRTVCDKLQEEAKEQPASLHEQQHNSTASAQRQSTYTNGIAWRRRPTWPPVSGFPRTSFCPKKPCGDKMTTLNMFGILDKKSKRRTESGASSRFKARFIVSFARATVLPQPGSKPSNCRSSEISEYGVCKHREAFASHLEPLDMVSASTQKQLQVVWSFWIWSRPARESTAFVRLKAAEFSVLACSDVFLWSWLQQSSLNWKFGICCANRKTGSKQFCCWHLVLTAYNVAYVVVQSHNERQTRFRNNLAWWSPHHPLCQTFSQLAAVHSKAQNETWACHSASADFLNRKAAS